MTTAIRNVLIIGDGASTAELVTAAFKEDDWAILAVHDLRLNVKSLRPRSVPDLILLNWPLPGNIGFSFLGELRGQPDYSRIPVILLIDKSWEEDRLACLENGADDYITIPFLPRELAAKAKALLRTNTMYKRDAILAAGPVVLDPNSFKVTINGARTDIGRSEYELLKFLMANPEQVYSRAQLLNTLWAHRTGIEERTVDVHMLRLRRALKDARSLIKTIHRVGYMLSSK